MKRWISLGLLSFSLVAGAGSAKKQAEAAAVLDQFADGRMNVNTSATRIGFLGMEAFATANLAFSLRKATDPSRRGPMLELLSRIAVPDDEAAMVFLRALGDEEVGNRMAAARGLGRMKHAALAVKLEPLLLDKALGVRREAARALGTLGASRSGAALMKAAAAEDDPEVRSTMITAVGQCGDTKQIAGLEALLETSSESARFAAGQALCVLGAPKGQAFAKGLLGSKDRSQRVHGVMVLDGAPAKVAKALLTPVLNDADPEVRARAAHVLYSGGDKAMLDWLVVEYFKAPAEAKVAYLNELDPLNVTDEQRNAILKKAGLK